jgi:uncharacterized membrane protein
MILILQEGAHSSAEPGIEGLVTQVVMWLKLGIETFGALIIGIGVLIAVYQILRALVAPQAGGYYRVRLSLSRFLALALEFQLAADILGTAIAPSWDQLGKLGAVAVLRTALNFFLGREMREEEAQSESTPAGRSPAEENAPA